ncbi:MAG: hypothetical protein QNK11_04875 [Legionella sp.]|nr:hypothetical protein [Legionella sp.]
MPVVRVLRDLDKKLTDSINFSAGEYVLSLAKTPPSYPNFFLVKTKSDGSILFDPIGHIEDREQLKQYQLPKIKNASHTYCSKDCQMEDIQHLRKISQPTTKKAHPLDVRKKEFDQEIASAYKEALLNHTLTSASFSDFVKEYKENCHDENKNPNANSHPKGPRN